MSQFFVNKKGVESFPFFLFLSLFVAVFVITIGFYQISSFRDFSSSKDMSESYNNLVNGMELLRSTSDTGSFTRVRMEIPPKSEMVVSPENNTITIKINGNEMINKPDFEIYSISDRTRKLHTESLALKSGTYELVLFYGNESQNIEPFQIFFR